MISAQFPVSLRDQIARNAQAQDRSISATLREAARVYLAQASPGAPSTSAPLDPYAMTGITGEGLGGAAAVPAASRREA